MQVQCVLLFQWSRAKIINNVLKKHFNNTLLPSSLWTTKQIVVFSHYHGYYPVNLKPVNSKEQQEKSDKYWGCFDSSDLGNSKAYKEKIAQKDLFENASVINTLSHMNIYCEKQFKLKEIKQEFETSDSQQSPMDQKQSSVFSNLKLEDDVNSLRRMRTYNILDSSDEEIDICGAFEMHKKKQNKKTGGHFIQTKNKIDDNFMPFEDEDEKLRCFYIERICADQGIELRNEHVGNGLTHR